MEARRQEERRLEERRLEERRLIKLYQEVEIPFIDVILEMENHGMQFEPDRLAKAGKDLHEFFDATVIKLRRRISKNIAYIK